MLSSAQAIPPASPGVSLAVTGSPARGLHRRGDSIMTAIAEAELRVLSREVSTPGGFAR